MCFLWGAKRRGIKAKRRQITSMQFQLLLARSDIIFLHEMQNAAIKKMDMQASKEFLAELKVLTHVHHLNLVIHASCYLNL